MTEQTTATLHAAFNAYLSASTPADIREEIEKTLFTLFEGASSTNLSIAAMKLDKLIKDDELAEDISTFTSGDECIKSAAKAILTHTDRAVNELNGMITKLTVLAKHAENVPEEEAKEYYIFAAETVQFFSPVLKTLLGLLGLLDDNADMDTPEDRMYKEAFEVRTDDKD